MRNEKAVLEFDAPKQLALLKPSHLILNLFIIFCAFPHLAQKNLFIFPLIKYSFPLTCTIN